MVGIAAQAYHEGVAGGAASTGPEVGHLAGATKVASSALGGLAAVLAKDARHRQALLAAASACLAAGVTTPVDLAFAGEGTVLPPAIQDVILDGCAVAGAREALEDMFRASRDGLKGNIALASRRLPPCRQGPSLTALWSVRVLRGHETQGMSCLLFLAPGSIPPNGRGPVRMSHASEKRRALASEQQWLGA